MPKQFDIFDKIDGKVDYVTLTIGGNDVGFSDRIKECVTSSAYLENCTLRKKINETKEKFNSEYRPRIKNAYLDISLRVGSQAHIIVAGYPKLLAKSGGFAVSVEEASIINSAVTWFNQQLQDIILECQKECQIENQDMDISFVAVEDKFDGHEAYVDKEGTGEEPWINPIWLVPRDQDIHLQTIGSAYSMHPNDKGAKCYADCVQEVISEIESRGSLSGKICRASDRTTPIANAEIKVSRVGESINKPSLSYESAKSVVAYRYYRSTKSDENGNYSLELSQGRYIVEINAPGYIGFKSYVDVPEKQNKYLPTFLMVEGEENSEGIANGFVINSLTGIGVEGVNLAVKAHWENTEGETIATGETTVNGAYSFTLPIGNYTVVATKEGFIDSYFNIIVQNGETPNQNGTISPTTVGNDYYITLTWDQDPRDLDSHVYGYLSNENVFHVYYRNRYVEENDTFVCMLDVDDVDGNGPEHITLNATSELPYYYYIHKYAGYGSIATSGAHVKVEQNNVLIAEFDAPTNLGNSNYWNVFSIVNGKMVVKNTITSEPDLEYANNSNSVLHGFGSEIGISSYEAMDCYWENEKDINPETESVDEKENERIDDTSFAEQEDISDEFAEDYDFKSSKELADYELEEKDEESAEDFETESQERAVESMFEQENNLDCFDESSDIQN